MGRFVGEFVAVLVVISAAVIVGAILGYDMGIQKQREVIVQCQKELPRNQYCTIIAVPEQEIKVENEE